MISQSVFIDFQFSSDIDIVVIQSFVMILEIKYKGASIFQRMEKGSAIISLLNKTVATQYY